MSEQPKQTKRSHSRRHRWQEDLSPGRGPKYWECIKCGLHKVTEYDSDNHYYTVGRGPQREWSRYAPPCPPEPITGDTGLPLPEGASDE
jgi:hypothetical protein